MICESCGGKVRGGIKAGGRLFCNSCGADPVAAVKAAKAQTEASRKNISQPADWWAAWEAEAKTEGVHLAEWIGECCNANLPKDVESGLSDRGTRGRPKNHKPKSG